MRQTDSIKDFQVKEETKLRKKLVTLNRDNVQAYFGGINDILNELEEAKSDLEANEQLRIERLVNARQICAEIKQDLSELRRKVLAEAKAYESNKFNILEKIEKKSPELLQKINELSKAEERLKELEFVRQFDADHKNIRVAVEKQDYPNVLKSYKKILVDDIRIPAGCLESYQKRLGMLNEFLSTALQEHLNELFTKIRFPFDDPVDYRIMKPQLDTSIELLRALQAVFKRTERDDYEAIQLVVDPFEKRFQFHFCGNKPTNDPSKPEWFLSQIVSWIENNSEYFEEYIQRLFDEWDLNEQADIYFGECLVKQVSVKVRSLLQRRSFVSNKLNFSHLLDETINFSNSIHEMFGTNTDIPEVISLFLEPEILDEWIGLEETAISIAIDGMLADPNAFQNRFDIANDIDALMVPNFADTFVILMQSMSERYLSFNDSNLRYRFLTHQLVIVDEFLQRIAQIFHDIETPWDKDGRYPQLMNALWFIAIVLDEWSAKEEFIQLNAVGTDQPLSRGTFDEMSDLYRHEWRKRARNLIIYFRDSIDYRIRPYANEKWFQMNHPKPMDFTVALGPFCDLTVQKIKWVWESISEDSRMTIYRMLNEEVWTCILENVVEKTAFASRGAAQMLFDVQTGLLPLLQSAFVPLPHLLKTDSAFKHFEVVKSSNCKEVISRLKVLALPSATAILLKAEIERIPESMLAEKLEPFKIDDIGRDKILLLFEQRCDMSQLASLMSEENDNVVYNNGEIQIEQLLVGYFDEQTGAACGSITLVSFKDYKILVDCGLPFTNFVCDCSTKIDLSSVNCVIVTHWHSDHCGQLHKLSSAHQILPDNNASSIEFPNIEQSGVENATQKLKLLKLSGHSLVDLVLVVCPNSTTDECIVIAGDLFENEADYSNNEPAVKGIDGIALIESRQFVRELNASIIVPGHGPAFRLRSTNNLMQEQHFGQVSLRLSLPANSFYDPVWLLEANGQQILINTRNDLELNKFLKDEQQLDAIVILKPSARSSCALGKFKANRVYMSEDVLHSPNTYSSLNENEWLVDGLIRVTKSSTPMTLKVEIFNPQTETILRVIGE